MATDELVVFDIDTLEQVNSPDTNLGTVQHTVQEIPSLENTVTTLKMGNQTQILCMRIMMMSMKSLWTVKMMNCLHILLLIFV